jgi:hypothetical protein
LINLNFKNMADEGQNQQSTGGSLFNLGLTGANPGDQTAGTTPATTGMPTPPTPPTPPSPPATQTEPTPPTPPITPPLAPTPAPTPVQKPVEPSAPIPPAPEPITPPTPPITPAPAAGMQTPPPQAFGVAQTGMPLPTVPEKQMAPPQVKEPEKSANYTIGGKLPAKLNVKVPTHSLDFDEQYFLKLLAGSISLTKDEKKKIIESVPKLKQRQIDELIRIFEEEKRKFAELSDKHVPQLQKLEAQHLEDWKDLEMEQQKQVKASADEQKADEIRKSLGL